MARRKKAVAKVGKKHAPATGKVAIVPASPPRPPVVIQASPQPDVMIPVQAAAFSAGVLSVQATGNDFLLLFMRPTPIQGHGGHGIDQTKALNVPVAVVTVSPQTAKDMSLLLAKSVAKHEAKYGKMITPFMERQAASGKKGKRAKKK